MGPENNMSGSGPAAESVAALVVVDQVLVGSASQVQVANDDVAGTSLAEVLDATVSPAAPGSGVTALPDPAASPRVNPDLGDQAGWERQVVAGMR